MEHSKNFEMIKGYYSRRLWSKERVRLVVGKPGGITAAEYEEITREPYNG